MFTHIPFDVPARFLSGLADGSLSRFGTIIKDNASGKIVAHVQESGVGQNLISSIVGSPFAPLNAISSIVANFQLAQLKTLVESLRALQFANLGVAAAGVGVSVVGFAVMNAKLKNLESAVKQVSLELEKQFAELYNEQLRRELSDLRGALEGVELAQRLKDPRSELNSLASSLTRISSVTRGRLETLLDKNFFDEALFTLFARALLTSDKARVEAYLLADELDSAHHAAGAIGDSYSNLFDALSPGELTNKLQISHQNNKGLFESELNTVGLKNMVNALRDITDAAMTKPLLIEDLRRQGISGPEYVQAVRDERSQPVVLLRA